MRKPIEVSPEQRVNDPKKAEAVDKQNAKIEKTDKVLMQLIQGGERRNFNGDGPYAEDLSLLREFLDARDDIVLQIIFIRGYTGDFIQGDR